MSLAELTVLFGLHTFRMVLFFLCHVVITLFTFCTCQCDFYAHDFSTSMCLLSPADSRFCRMQRFRFLRQTFFFALNLGTKKRPTSTVAFPILSQKQVFVNLFFILLDTFYHLFVVFCHFFYQFLSGFFHSFAATFSLV